MGLLDSDIPFLPSGMRTRQYVCHVIIYNWKGDRNWLDVEIQPRHHHSDQYKRRCMLIKVSTKLLMATFAAICIDQTKNLGVICLKA